MTVKSNSNYSAQKRYDFPKLMISQYHTIVLFNAMGKGVAVESHEHEEVGCYSSDWAMSNFKDYHGDVTLTNY